MNIDKKDFERLSSKLDKPTEKKHIIDVDKYFYWNAKADEFTDLCVLHKDDKEKHLKYLHQLVLSTLERNEYYRIPKKDMILLWIIVKYHNSKCEDKVFIDKRGRKVNKHDRRAVRDDATRK